MGKGDVVMRGFLLSFWVILLIHVIFGCSGDSGKENQEQSSPLHFRELAWVNRLNQGNYEFGGSCTGSGTLSYDLVEVTEEENPEKWSGKISCANEKWNEVVNLDNFQDGDISLVVSFGNYTSPLMMFKKDTVIPTFSFPTVDSAFQKKFKLAGECSEDGEVAVSLTGKEDVLAGEVCRNNQWEVAIDFADQPDNQYEFSVHFKDLAGNPANQRDFTITKDSTPPILTLDNQDQLPAINNNNNDSYNIAGDCENNGPLVVTIGEHPLSTQPTCSNGRWTAQLPLDLELGEVIITVNHSDPLGNQAPAIVARTTKDTVAPTLTGTVSFSPGSGQHNSGVPLSFTVNFNEDVVVTNTPRLHLDFTSGETTTLKYATYSSSSGSEVIFIYSVAPGDHADSIALGHGSLIDLNGGSITDRAGNSAELSTTLTAGLTGVSINAAMPILKLVSAPADSFVKSGDSAVTLTATFSTPVSVTGSPLLQLRVGRLTTEYATFSGSVNSASATHEFSYRPIAGDGTVQVTGVTDGTIQDDSNLNLAAVHQAISVSGLVVDNTAPAITGVDDDSQVATSKTWSWGCNDEKGCTYRHVVDNAATTELAGNFNDVITATVDTGTTRYYLHVQATDKAGNKSPVRHVYADVDNSVATISSTRPPAEKTYSLGEALDFVVEFSEDVTVVGGPRIILALQSGGTTYADYHSGSGSRELVFRYQVAEGDLDENGIELANSNMIDLNNGRIVGGADQDAQLSALSFSGLPRIRVDGIKPTLTVSGTQGRYKAGDTIPLLITFSKEVIITGGIPEIRLEIGAGNTIRKDILTGSGNTRSVQYQVQAGENDDDGIRVLGLHLPPGVEIKDGNGNELDLANYEAEALSQVRVGIEPPFAINYPSRVGDTWHWSCRSDSPCTYRFTFNQAISPAFSETDAFSATSSAKQPDSLVDGDYYYLHIEAKNTVGNTGALSHSFRFKPQDNTPPIVSRVTVEDGSYKDSILISVDFGEPVLLVGGTSGGTPELQLQVGAHRKSAYYIETTGTKMVFKYTIRSGDTDENGVALVSGSIIDNIGDKGIQDSNDNLYDETALLPTLSGVAKVDTTKPALVSASSSGNYKAGDKAIIAVTFNEAVSLEGSPQLEVRSSDGETARITAVGEEHLSRTHDFTYLVADGQDGSVEIILAVSGSPKIRDAARNAVMQNSLGTAISVTGLTVDTTPPALPTPTKSETTWSWSCTDALTSCTSYFIFNQRPSHFFTPEEGLTPSTSATQPNDLLPGTNYIHVQAQDEAGNVALNSVQFQVAGTDSTSPTVNRVRVLDGNYSIGDEVKIIVEFNETVSLFRNSATDTPTIQLQVGSTAKTANYTETSGGDMIFVYTVASGDADEDGPGLSSGATIVLPAGASIKDSSSNLFGNSAALPAISQGEARIDGIRPTLASAAGSGSYRKDQSVTFTLTFNEEVLVTGGNIQLKLRYSDGEEITVDSEGEQRPSQTHDFSYQVQNGQNGTIEIIELGVSSSGKIEDGAGNTLTTGILAQAVSILGVSVDTTAPVVTINTPVAATSSNQANYPLGGSCEGNTQLTIRIIEGQDPPPVRTVSCENRSWSGHFDLSAFPDNASYGVMAEQTDAAGNTSERAWEDIVKGTPPVYTRIMPLSGISGDEKRTCALDSGQVQCWGSGLLGDGVGNSLRNDPVTVQTDESGHPPLDNIIAISIRNGRSLALESNGELWGWGLNSGGLLQVSGTHKNRAIRPRNTQGQVLDNKFIQISVGDSNICTLRSNGEIWCWGHDFPQDPDRQDIRGQIIKDRYGRKIDKFIQVISGYKHFCGLFYTGQVWCWGAGEQGQLGNGLSVSQDYAAPVRTSFTDSTPLGNVVLVRVKGNHTCALLADGTTKCWGQGSKGQLGDGVEENSLHDHGHLYPVTVRDSENAGGSSLENLVDLDTGQGHSCALDSSGGAFCWGNQYHGRLGNGQSSSIRSYPDSVTVLKGDTVANFSRISQISLGGYHSCARTWRGHIYCWGSDTYGQLGDGVALPNQTRATLVTKSGSTPSVFGGSIPATFGAGEFQHSYICQNANCTLQDISLSLGESRETFNNDDSPTINVAGIDTGETVDLYSDSDCATQVGVEATETNPSVSLTGLNDGVHRFYFTVESEENTSACSQRPLIYTLDTVVPEVTLTRTNGVWNWSCNNADENCIYRHVINTNASHTFGSADSYGVAITATATAEGQYIHLQSRDGAGNESTVATNGPVPADEVPDL